MEGRLSNPINNKIQAFPINSQRNEFKLAQKIGFSACPNDVVDLIKREVDYVCKNDGGKGTFRELADLILTSKFPNKHDWY